MKRLNTLLLTALFLLVSAGASAQHTLGVTGGYGSGSARFFPDQESRSSWGNYTAGVKWRYYGTQRFVGGFGLDLELLQRTYSFAPNAPAVENEADYKYYTRRLNSIVLPVVWEPHIYIRRSVRIFLEAMATFSYNFDSTYENEMTGISGKYEFKTPRDNRWGYGLAGGGGVAVLVGRIELMARVRYYFGFADILRNRNVYSGNGLDGSENPFAATPLRSPLDNLTISFGVSYRFNKEGFSVWNFKRAPREKSSDTFEFKGATPKKNN